MPRRSLQHSLLCFRFVTTTKRQAPNNPTFFSNTTTKKRWVTSLEKKPDSISVASSASGNTISSRQRMMAAYATAGATLGVATCYRPDSMIAYDPYNLGGIGLAVLAFHRTNPAITMTSNTAAASLPFLLVSLVVGEFLGNGFRLMHRQYSAITVTDEDRHQLRDDIGEMTSKQSQVDDSELLGGKDLLDIFEDTIEAVMLQAKTRWAHLSGFYETVPDHMTQHELKIAIHRWAYKASEEDPQGAAEEKESLLQVMSVADINNDGIITFMEFSRALLLLELSKRNLTSAKSELYFRAIDLNNSGSISEDELLHFARRLHVLGGIPHKDRTTPHWSGLYERPSTAEEVCSKWMRRFDVNNDGVISREEFTKMAKEIDFGPSFLFTKYFDRTSG